jgi:hypothetical protein
VLERPLRATMIEAMMRAPPIAGAQLEQGAGVAAGWWLYRTLFWMQLLVFGLIAVALTRPRVLALYKTQGQADQDL